MSLTRITTLMTSNQILSEINSSQAALANTEEELSSGKTINQPSDNPYGAALAVQLNGQLSQLNDYNNNITDGQAWTQTATSALNTTDLTDLQTGLNSLGTLQTQLGTTTDSMTMAASTLSDMQTSVTSDLSNDTEANMATTETTYSNEEAAFEAALKAGASIVQSSLMDFLSSN
jgi:flagellin-like hook-associated protein FlgL